MTAPAAKSARPAKAAKAATPAKAAAGLADKLARLGLAREEDLVLHLPLRYEDHTRLVPLARLQPGLAQQAEGTVVHTDIQYRPRRQLVCLLEDGADGNDDRAPVLAAAAAQACLLEDGADGNGDRAQLVLRFFTFYPNQQKALAPGRRVRAFGDVRPGHFGLRSSIRSSRWSTGTRRCPTASRPSIRRSAGVGQDTLRRVIARAIAADPARTAGSLAAGRLRRAPPAVEVRRRRPLPAYAAAGAVAADAARARRAHAPGVDAPEVRRAVRAAALVQVHRKRARGARTRRCSPAPGR